MRAECKHDAAAPLVRAGMIARVGGGTIRGCNVAWCQQCGAVRAEVDGEPCDWVLPTGATATVTRMAERVVSTLCEELRDAG